MTPLPTNQWGISPTAPTLPRPEWSVAVTGRTSGIRSPSRLRSRRGYLLRAREQGQAWDGGVGPGWGGQHRSILGRLGIIIVSRLTLSLTITKPLADILCISMCVIPEKQFWMCGLGIELAQAHFTSEHALSLSHKHTLSIHRHTVITTGTSQQTYTSDCEWYSSS